MTGPQLLSITWVGCWGDHVKWHSKVSKRCRYLLLKAFWIENFSSFITTVVNMSLRKFCLVAFWPILGFLCQNSWKWLKNTQIYGCGLWIQNLGACQRGRCRGLICTGACVIGSGNPKVCLRDCSWRWNRKGFAGLAFFVGQSSNRPKKPDY